MTDRIDICNPDGKLIREHLFSAGCVRRFSLMNEDSITLKFSTREALQFPVGTSAGDFYITQEQLGKWNESTGAWDYELKFDAYYRLLANKILRYIIPGAESAMETSFVLTATIDVHAAVILNCLEFLGFKYKGSPFRVDTSDTSLSAEAKLVRYENLSVLGGIEAIAEAFECEWWVTGNAICFGRCENDGASHVFEAGVNVSSISFQQASSESPNRIYVFGSERNLPVNYRKTDGNDTIGGVVVRRLMLPEGVPYLQTDPEIPESQIVEKVVVLDDVYPHTDLTVTEDPETYTSHGEDDEGEETTETFYQLRYDPAFLFSERYVLPNEELHIVFQSGLLNGMDFGVRFNPKGVNERNTDGSWNPEAQMLEVVVNEDYGRRLPDDILKPQKGDNFILYGWDATKMEDLGLLADAERELLDEGKKALEDYAKDLSTCTCPMAWDYMKPLFASNSQPKPGDVVTILDTAHFGKGGRRSRIIGYEYKLDQPYAECVYTCGENVSVKRLDSIERKIDGLTKSGSQVQMRNSLDFLSKRYSDRSPYQIASDVAIEVGDFLTGVSGAKIGKDAETGQTFGEMDRLFIRVKAYFDTLTIINSDALAGEQRITPGGGVKCTSVEELDDVYRCYFLSEQDGEKTETKIIAGDQAIAQMFNAKTEASNKVSNHRYWRLVTAVSNDAYTDDSGNRYGYIDLSKADCEKGSDIPQAGDTIVQFGNRTDHTRQAAMVFSTVDADAPSIKLLTGIGSGDTNTEHYSLAGRDIISYGYDSVKGYAYFRCYGDTYIGSPNGSTFVKYDREADALDIKARLTILPSSTIGDKTLEEYFLALIPEIKQEDIENFVNAIVDPKIEGIQNQIDGVIETWFYNGVPTLGNYPANGWDTDSLRIQHLGDLYYDNDTGTAYRFSQNAQGGYYWNIITDDAITKALEAAKEAQDTADKKRRIFTEQPKPSYDEGDLWVNAEYYLGAGNYAYRDDILRCSAPKKEGQSFDIKDWEPASRYTDDTKANEALSSIRTYEYIKTALAQDTQISGGLMMTTLISLGYTDEAGLRHTLAGMNGSWIPELGGRTIASWYGGNMVDLFDKDDNRVDPVPTNAATSLTRMDGSAYFANGNIGFRADGSGWLGNDTNGIRFGRDGSMTLGSGIKINLNGGDEGLKETVESLLNFNLGLSNLLKPCNAKDEEISWEEAAIEGRAKSLKAKLGLWTDEFLSARGKNDAEGGGVAGGLDIAMLEDYLTDNKYATQPWVTSALGNYYSKAEADARFLRQHQSLADYVTLNTVQTIRAAKTFTDELIATEKWITAKVITGETGAANNTVQRKKAHGIELGYPNRDYMNFNEFGGVFNFYKTNRAYTAASGDGTLVASITESGITAASFIRQGGTSSQFLKADGSVDTNTYLTSHQSLANYYTKSEVDAKDKRLVTYYPSRPTTANVNFGNNAGLYTFLATSSMTSGKPAGDGHILHMEWDNSLSWAGQIAVPNRGDMQWRYQQGNTWQAWRTILDSSNFDSLIGSGLTAYVKKAGDTMTGMLSIKTDTQPCLKLDSVTANKEVYMYVYSGGVAKNAVGWNNVHGSYIYNSLSAKYLGIKDNGTPHFQGNTLWHAGNDGAGSGLNADLLDGWHAAGQTGSVLKKSGYVSSATSGLSSYWGKLATINVSTNENKDITLYLHSAFNNFYGTLNINIRINSGGESYTLRMLDGNIPVDRIRLYKAASAPRVFELWVNVVTQYGVINAVVLSETDRVATESGAWVTMHTTYFTTVQTPTLATYITPTYTSLMNNASSATRLQNPRTLWGQSFDGTADVTGGFRELYQTSALGNVVHSILNYPTAPYGLLTRIYGDGAVSLQSQRESNSSECFILSLNPLGGNVGIGTIAPTRKLHVSGDIQTVSIYASNWFRSTGATGWYNETYGGGWYMSDTTWIRINGGKSLYAGAGTIRTDYLFTREDYAGAAWNAGYGAYNVQIYDNAAQTPLLLAYRRGTRPVDATGADRLFSMELLNTGGELRFSFGGSSVFRMTKFGEFQAIRSVQSSAWFSDSGQIRANAMGTSYYLGMGAATDGYGVIQGGKSGTGAIPLLLNPKGGNVGVGLVPSFKLHVAGDIKANGGIYTGNLTAHNGVGGSGCQICDGNIELFGSLCYIDFHHGNTTTDYTSRIIELEPGVITIEGQLHVTGGIWTEGFMTARQGNRMTALVDDHEERIAALEAENASLKATIENMI